MPTLAERLGGIKDFSSMFWLANSMELFERAAYYGMLAVLSFWCVRTLGFSEGSAGILIAVMIPFLYVLPIFSGALADKYGYKKMLIFAFAMLSIGYFITSQMRTYATIMLFLIVMAIGAGTFKPIVSSTIARSTTPEQRNMGYGIYYWMINVGAAIAPLIVVQITGAGTTSPQYHLAFVFSGAMCLTMLLIVLIFYQEPERDPNPKSVGDVMKGAALVLGDRKFVTLLLIYSGFWFMYALFFLPLMWYMDSYVDMTPVSNLLGFQFTVVHLNAINPLTIIALGAPLSRLIKGIESLNCMVLGISTAIFGLLIIGASTFAWALVVGIMIFSIGEFVTHPTYISYVSKIAPKEKLAVYMGYAFLPVFIGQTAGNAIGGFLYELFADNMGMPRLLWVVGAAVGLLTLVLLILYNKYIIGPTIGGAATEKEPEEGKGDVVPEKAEASEEKVDKVPARALSLIPSGVQAMGPLIVILLLLGALLGVSSLVKKDPLVSGLHTQGETWFETVYVVDIQGTVQEQSSVENPVNMPPEASRVLTVIVTLTFTDEETFSGIAPGGATNDPDELEMTVGMDMEDTVPMTVGGGTANGAGNGIVAFSVPEGTKYWDLTDKTLNITLTAGECGDLHPRFDPGGFRTQADDSVAWTIGVTVTYQTKELPVTPSK